VPTCVFCEIAHGTAPAHRIWEDKNHLAFLSTYPNTPGFAVVITKAHIPSDAFAADDTTLTGLVLAAKTVGRKITTAFEDVGRTGLIFEGFGVDHLHAKLFPMHGTGDLTEWEPFNSNVDKFFDRYEGYISSHNYRRADDAELQVIAEKIRNTP